ncbi:Stringent starvation protein A [Defluviimonas aquaemixtae]|uniref:glutathione transferase n=1 Tax=Albidovulum aquaemixtae TaxID=1542388 RepID=A0A2R8B7S0_9RHOB|nr:glutathione S-transferase family protein [Defluviimonas aquaemixtae]SPH18626.1 Stringent starvation protein A [Defluviimonas aquaemixtae]
MQRLTLVSHHLCPYVQRAAIALAEKDVPHERIDIDLAKKPDWFLALSPLGKTPVLKAGGQPIFESAAILEYLEETRGQPLHPKDPVTRAQHRGWIEYASTVLSDIARLYNAADAEGFAKQAQVLHDRFARIDEVLEEGPWFAGQHFSLVDAAFAPVFRYFDVLDEIGDFGILAGYPQIAAWRAALAGRPSVRNAVAPDYPQRLRDFFARRGSYLSDLLARQGSRAA